MAEEIKQRIRAKPTIQKAALNGEDLLLIEHAPNTLDDADKALRLDEAKKYFTDDLKSSVEDVTGRIDVAEPKIEAIEDLIPNSASVSNQLADKDFVNSSIATNTANFIGRFDSLEELESYSGPLTNNDYAFVKENDELGKPRDARYKYKADDEQWMLEYYLNNSSFTADQWNAIDSGITAEKVAIYDAGMSPLGIVNLIYPIGSIYTSINNINPGSIFANTTWEKVSSGRVLQGATEDQEGGQEIEPGLPNIKGSLIRNNIATANNGTGAFSGTTFPYIAGYGATPSAAATTLRMEFNANNGVATAAKGIYRDDCNTVQPPAFTVHFWKRTA